MFEPSGLESQRTRKVNQYLLTLEKREQKTGSLNFCHVYKYVEEIDSKSKNNLVNKIATGLPAVLR